MYFLITLVTPMNLVIPLFFLTPLSPTSPITSVKCQIRTVYFALFIFNSTIKFIE